MQLVPNTGFVQTESYVRKNKHMQLDLSAHTKNDSKLEKTPVAISVSYKRRLDFRRLPGPVFDECGLIFPNSGWLIEPTISDLGDIFSTF